MARIHVLIATDGSGTAVDAARRAFELFDRAEHVTLLSVLTSVPGENVDDLDEPASSPEEEARQWEVELRQANRELARTADVISSPQIDTRIEAGDIAWTISRVAQELGADLVVLGARRPHGLRRAIRRSVAERVLRNTTSMVLVVPERDCGQR